MPVGTNGDISKATSHVWTMYYYHHACTITIFILRLLGDIIMYLITIVVVPLLSRVSHAPHTVLRVLQEVSHLIPTTVFWVSYYCPHSTDEKTEAESMKCRAKIYASHQTQSTSRENIPHHVLTNCLLLSKVDFNLLSKSLNSSTLLLFLNCHVVSFVFSSVTPHLWKR